MKGFDNKTKILVSSTKILAEYLLSGFKTPNVIILLLFQIFKLYDSLVFISRSIVLEHKIYITLLYCIVMYKCLGVFLDLKIYCNGLRN